MAMRAALQRADNAGVRSSQGSVAQTPAVAQRFAPLTKNLLQRKASCACGGVCPRCQAKSALTVSQPTDPAEREADAVAEQVMRMTADAVGLSTHEDDAFGFVHSESQVGEDERKTIRRRALPSGGEIPSHSPRHVEGAIRSGGMPLDRQTRSFFEPRLGYDLSSIRIHTHSTASQSAHGLNARAYTIGNNIVFGGGEYNPRTETGRHLLAHELAHVAQQNTRNAICRAVGRLDCVAGAASAPADPRGGLTAIDARAQDMAQQLGADLGVDATTVRGGIPAAPSASLQSFIDHFGLPPAEGARFVNRLTGELRPSQEIATNEELRILSRRFALIARILGDRIHYVCGTGPINLGGGCADDCSSNDFDAFTCRGVPGIGLCPNFWTGYADDDARAAIIVHEMLHMIFGPTNPRGIGQIGDETQRGIGRNFNVAGCYEFIIDDVFGTDSAAACPGIP